MIGECAGTITCGVRVKLEASYLLEILTNCPVSYGTMQNGLIAATSYPAEGTTMMVGTFSTYHGR